MKANIHPQYFEAQVTCVCGNRFTTGSTKEKIHVELCDKCHPFYTGEQKFIDSTSRIVRFTEKRQKADEIRVTKVKKVEEKRQLDSAPKTLREMLLAIK